MSALRVDQILLDGTPQQGTPLKIAISITIDDDVIFDLDVAIAFYSDNENRALHDTFLSQNGWRLCWLPKGQYEINWSTSALVLPPGVQRIYVRLYSQVKGEALLHEIRNLPFLDISDKPAPRTVMPEHWDVCSLHNTPPLESLGWQAGHQNWFFRHFHHAACTIFSYMCGNSPLLRGRVLDVGCGDGITDLGFMLRYQPQELIGIDPFRGFERLPQILADNHLGHLKIPENLKFMPEDANVLPFEDNSFDALISWGSVEHIAGGYHRALEEMRRVLKPGGLLFITPGLYYSNLGSHLGEFSNEPYVHLKKTHEELRDLVLNTPPNYIDRSGEFSSPAQFWQWYTELNPITIANFERELRDLDFEPWRFAIRVEDLVEYTPAMQQYSMLDLGCNELYLSCYNRKNGR